MEAPLVEEVDDASVFFLRDAALRLSRVIEQAFAYALAVLLLYCRLILPGVSNSWAWAQGTWGGGLLWVAIFVPLFLIDLRNLRHWQYLRTNSDRFANNDSKRYLLICTSEVAYKALMLLWLAVPPLRSVLTLRIVMLPYVLGYILHFVLGHFLPLEDPERAEGCNIVATLVTDLARFLVFVLVISLTLKVDHAASTVYDWEAAFWPCWGLEGILILVVMLVLPTCLVATVGDRRKALMFTWVIVSCLSLGATTFYSMYNLARLLDEQLCPAEPWDTAASASCRAKLGDAIWPWLLFLPAFGVGTSLLKRPLAVALHESWYQPARDLQSLLDGSSRANLSLRSLAELPPPAVLFRVTPTYYSRCPEAILEDAEHCGSMTLAQGSGHGGREAIAMQSVISQMSVGGSRLKSLDPSASILSARGATFADIVESEQLCFVCYDQRPEAVLLECGHAGLCCDCATFLMERRPGQGQCPICRGSISSAYRLRADLPTPPNLFAPRGPATSQPASEAARALCTEDAEDPLRATIPSEVSSIGGAAPTTGPPWPQEAKRFAVPVELLRRLQRPARGRWWLLSPLRQT